MRNRPALLAAMVIAAGTLIAHGTSADWHIFVIPSSILLIISIVESYALRSISGRAFYHSPSFLLLLFFSAAALWTVSNQVKERQHLTRYLSTTDSLMITCTIVDMPKVSDDKMKLLVSVTSIANEFDTVETDGRAYLTIYPEKRKSEIPLHLRYGNVITIKSILQSPAHERNPGEFSYRDYLALNNIFATISLFGYSRITIHAHRETNPFFEHIIFPSKDFVVKTITTVMKGDEANFLVGLLLGDRTDLSDEIKTAFMNTGTIHVLAVSGSHVVLVAEIIFVIVGFFRLTKKPRILLSIAGLLYYMWLTGATPSVVRATLMMILYITAKYFEERSDVYNILGASAVIILAIEPKQLFDVGFQLSFSAVFSIVYFYPKLNSLFASILPRWSKNRILHFLWQLFAVSLAAQIGTLPFTAWYFGQISIVSLFANIIVVPIVGLIVTIGLCGALLGVWSIWIASVFSEVNNLLAIITLQFVKWAEQVPYAIVSTAGYGFHEAVLYSAFVGVLFNHSNRLIQKRILFVSMTYFTLILYTTTSHKPMDTLRITFLDVGQGDCAVIQFPAGETVVVDGGPVSPSFDAGEKIVAPFLKRNGISAIDAIIMTHPHADHLGGIPYLMQQFSVKRMVDAGQQTNSKLYRQYSELEKSLQQSTVRAGIIQSISNARLYYLHPTNKFVDDDSTNGYSNINESSVVFKLVYGATSILFTGDAEKESEEHLTRIYGDFLQSDVLKAGHHGSSTSSNELFVSAVQPKEVVLSVAKFNKFRHPSSRVIERFRSSGAFLHRTDEEGGIVFETDGQVIRKVSWREN